MAVLLVGAGGVYFGAKNHEGSLSDVSSNAAGGSPATSSTPAVLSPGSAEYLATGSTFVDLIQWNDEGGTLSGTAQEVSTQGTAPDLKTVTDTFGLSGFSNGSVISVSFNHGIQVSGTMVSGSFTVLFPQLDGTMGLVNFRSATPTQYSSAVASLNQHVDLENQSAGGAQALQQAAQTIDSQAATVQSDISGLSRDETATTSAMQAIAGTLQDQTNEITTTHWAEQQVAAESGSASQSTTCGGTVALAADASVVAGNSQDVGREVSVVEATLSVISGMRAAIARLNSDYSLLQKDEAAASDYVPPDAPSQSDVSEALSNANSALQSALSTTNGEIDQANAAVSTAYQYVSQGYQAARNCGTAPSPPAPLQNIT